MQCHVLERFLSLVLATAGVELRYGAAFLRIEGNDSASEGHVAVVQQRRPPYFRAEDKLSIDSEETIREPFALLVGADGGRSVVRDAMGAVFLPQEQFSIEPFLHEVQTDEPGDAQKPRTVKVAGLNQTTLIMSFAQQGRECPTLALHDDGECSLPSTWHV
jgi:2-polyprenyl-6-methoxyphenol hydroxylase-like FAD-dependent oxidoreductase